MDFVEIKEKMNRNGSIEVYPNFRVRKSKDLMVRGKAFYAIWDEEAGMWSTDEYDVQRLVDKEIKERIDRIKEVHKNTPINAKTLGDFSSKMWTEFQNYASHQPDCSHPLDEKITFANTEIKRSDYVSKRLDYPLEEGTIEAYDELMSTLYSKEERDKLEWAIGAVIDGDAKKIQKFIVLYGEAGTGKSTILNIIQKLFKGYYTTFEAKALTSNSNAFATEVFKDNPLVAIQHDGDLSRIEDNTKLNSIVSHEMMTMNEKYKSSYMARTNCFLFMGTNRPVKITDAKSGVIRRLIDVKPTGDKVSPKKYQALMSQIDFELGAIAYYCLNKYHEMGKNYYSDYRPLDMIFKTDVFFNFVESNYYTFKEQNGTTLGAAYEMYKVYCDDALVDFKLPRHKFREELKNYFKKFDEVTRIDGKQVRSYYSEFILEKFSDVLAEEKEVPCPLVLECTESIFDKEYSECPAQYASANETPKTKWENNNLKLKDIDTSKVHYVKVPENHIVIDFDIKDKDGKKSFSKNLEAASKWPKTYAEFSKSGAGIHLHYIYDGDASKLSRIYDDSIEIKVFTGNSSLRRKLTKCNNLEIAHINSGLPLKGKKMINFDSVKNEKALRTLIKKNLNKEIHPGTKPSVDFIHKILEDAYSQGMKYDVTDMRPAIMAFANNSTNHSQYCLELVSKMHFCSEDSSESPETYSSDEIVFWDVEVFPNLFLVNWKFRGKDKKVVRMINPSPSEIEEILKFKLVGFNNRRYDNHILYARLLGYTNEELFRLSQRIISGSQNAMFAEAYNLSYTDVYDFCSKKQSLKKWEIELGIHHQELGLPWDQPVPEEKWVEVAEYCDNDVIATEAVFEHNQADWTARQILAKLSGLTVNHKTNSHSEKIIFGNDPHPQQKFIYPDLSETFPGYVFENGHSSYMGEDPSEGGYVYAEPGIYSNVALLDVESLHPTTIEVLNLFGPYTKNFSMLKKARVLIKHNKFDEAKKLFNGKLAEFLDDETMAKQLAYALKIVINSVYGLTSAKFDNKFRDKRNIDNVVAKRGALFMIALKNEVQKRGFTVAHVKTDSIKIPNANEEIISFVMDFGHKYGYNFEHEATYDRMCLVNNAVYIAKIKEGDNPGTWSATGAQFAQPYVFKHLFSKEPIEFDDTCETKSVAKGAMYLDMNEGLPEDEHNYQFIGKAGQFCPIKPGCGGGLLMALRDDKYNSVTGTKGYRWLESEVVKELHKEEDIDLSYYTKLVDDSVEAIDKYGDFEKFVSEEPYELDLPWY